MGDNVNNKIVWLFISNTYLTNLHHYLNSIKHRTIHTNYQSKLRKRGKIDERDTRFYQ